MFPLPNRTSYCVVVIAAIITVHMKWAYMYMFLLISCTN